MLQELLNKKTVTTQSAKGEIPYFDAFVSQGLRRPQGHTATQLFEISPDLAEHILMKYHGNNRRLSLTHVENLKNAIRASEWKVTAQGISINADGRLDDGQHRMHAIIAAQRSVLVQVTVNADPAGFDVLDSGRKRTSGDVLSIDGYHDPNNLAAAARTLLGIQAGDISKRFSNTEILQFVECNERLVEAVKIGHRVAKHVKCPTSGLAVAFFLIQRDTNYPGVFPEFINRLCDGAELKAGSPVLALRAHLLAKAYSGNNNGRQSRSRMVGAIIKAWNAYATSRSRKHVGHNDTSRLPSVK